MLQLGATGIEEEEEEEEEGNDFDEDDDDVNERDNPKKLNRTKVTI
jgi:hypothetical protein